MNITIANRLRPFSHKVGSQLLIPGTDCVAEIYPAFLKIMLPHKRFLKIKFALRQMVDDFTCVQDLERRYIEVFFRSQEGYFKYQIKLSSSQIIFFLKKAAQELVCTVVDDEQKEYQIKLKEKTEFVLKDVDAFSLKKVVEKLSFGCHKKQDLELLQRRSLPEEFLPFWFHLGQITPQKNDFHKEKLGFLQYLHTIKPLLADQQKEEALKHLKYTFKAGFKDFFVPLLYDENHYGFSSEGDAGCLSMDLLTDGYRFIRDFFIKKQGQTIAVLPHLPKDFHCGRLTFVQEEGLLLDIEWSKKFLKKMKIMVQKSQKISFAFQKPLLSYRLRSFYKEKGQRVGRECPLKLEEGKTYYFDNFMK